MDKIEDEIVIGFAETPDEREAVFRQRYCVYTEEMHLYQSVADNKRKILTDPFDSTSRILYARIGEEVVGSLRFHTGCDGCLPDPFKVVYDLERFAATVPYEQMSVVTRFMVNKAYRRGRATFELLQAAYEHHLQNQLQLAFIACAPHLVNLYLATGFRTYTKNYSDPEVGFVIPMVIVLRDLNYLKRVKALLWRTAARNVTMAEVPPWATSILPPDSSVLSERSDAEEYWTRAHALLVDESEGKYHIFDKLSEDQIKVLLLKGHVIACSNGELIIRKGTVSHGMSIVLSGVVEVRDGDRVLAILRKGDVLGEIGFLLAAPRSASVYAVSEEVKVLNLDEKTLLQLIETNQEIAAKLLLNLSKIVCLRLIEVQSKFNDSEASGSL